MAQIIDHERFICKNLFLAEFSKTTKYLPLEILGYTTTNFWLQTQYLSLVRRRRSHQSDKNHQEKMKLTTALSQVNTVTWDTTSGRTSCHLYDKKCSAT